MTIKEVAIGSNVYESYADVEQADAWLYAAITATKWQAAVTTGDTKSRCLISATRWIDEQAWLGEKTDSAQPHAFPRTGIAGVADDEIPIDLDRGCIELANALLDTPALFATIGKPLAKSLGAGPARIDFFRPEDVQVVTPFPKVVMAYLGQYLAGSSSGAGGPQPSGTDGCSQIDSFGLTRGF